MIHIAISCKIACGNCSKLPLFYASPAWCLKAPWHNSACIHWRFSYFRKLSYSLCRILKTARNPHSIVPDHLQGRRPQKASFLLMKNRLYLWLCLNLRTAPSRHWKFCGGVFKSLFDKILLRTGKGWKCPASTCWSLIFYCCDLSWASWVIDGWKLSGG